MAVAKVESLEKRPEEVPTAAVEGKLLKGEVEREAEEELRLMRGWGCRKGGSASCSYRFKWSLSKLLSVCPMMKLQ
jgi:hypothetical protein